MSSESFNKSDRGQGRLMLRYLIGTLCLGLLLWASWTNARDGLSSLWSRKSVTLEADAQSRLDRAHRVSPSNPRPLDIRARYLVYIGNFSGAAKDFESAIALKPHDYLLWLRLGNAREQMGDQKGAVSAYYESIRLAPYYSMPHWYLGNLFLDMKNLDQAFAELQQAATIDPRRLPTVIDYAWKEFNGDPAGVRRALQPRTQSQSLTLAHRFLNEGKISDAMILYRDAGVLQDSDRQSVVTWLLGAKAYAEAYEVWSAGRVGYAESPPSSVRNGDFEFDLDPTAVGFEWHVPGNLAKANVVRDDTQPQSGAYSLRIDFDGNSAPGLELISQTVLTEGGVQYQLEFAARTLRLVSGGLPMVEIVDAANGQSLMRSAVIPENQTKWEHYTLQFTTPGNTRAVILVIKRANCSSSPCPAFGHAWFDNFILKKL